MSKMLLGLFVVVAHLALTACGYKDTEEVPFQANTLFPLNNPMETRRFYELPYCKPKEGAKLENTFSHSLSGDRPMTSPYVISFMVPVSWNKVCDPFTLEVDDVSKFIKAIDRDERFEMLLDNQLSIVGSVGFKDQSLDGVDHYYLFNHLQFDLVYNGGVVMGGNISMTENKVVEIVPEQPKEIQFSYAVSWQPTKVPSHRRAAFHAKLQGALSGLVEEVHWLSVINTFLLVVLLVAALSLILMRTVKNDFTRYMQLDEVLLEDADEEVVDDSGWKMVHGDVFRAPKHIMLFSACIGTGRQIFALVFCILSAALVDVLHPGATRGAIYVAAVVLYAMTAGIAGYISCKLYTQLGGDRWLVNAILTASLFALPFLTTFSVINSVAIYYNSTSALPFQTILSLILLWAFITLPLTIIGARLGNRRAGDFNAPCPTNKITRFIPECRWYHRAPFQMVVAGFLPFTAIYIELHTIFNSIWGHQVYTLFGILALAFLMLIIVTSCLAVALSYFLLTTENYHWWWRSFLSGGSTGVFIYLYAVFFYVYRSQMDGVLQGTMFFGYMLMISYAFALMLGSISYMSSCKFIRHIYGAIKVD